MEQGIQPAASSSAAAPPQQGDLPAKKLVRQLDFTSTAYPGNPAVAAAAAAVSRALDQRPLPQQILPAPPPPPPQPPQLPQPPPPQPQPQPQVQQPVPRPSIPLVVFPLSLFRKPESPKSRTRQHSDAKDGTPTRKKNCNCKNSRCLKL
ncbi:Protein tesmin/TSO1-like CXC 6 [Ananas comosus]|uniref:Protein tesmin/TSO1-like CXC 6 n=1 Tax=Ananas comosus TaxID=4615 RepID=A0A199VUL5_ANACO|nr:Protein tesmin/TSO1-like CXC 6 [Ananas comosus]